MSLWSTMRTHIADDPLLVLTTFVQSALRNMAAEWVFFVVMGVALACALFVDVRYRRNIRARYLTKNVRTDVIYMLVQLSHLPQLFIIGPVTVGAFALVRFVAPWWHIAAFAQLPLYAQVVAIYVIKDFFVYWQHRFEHEWPVLWQFHKTHHSQSVMTPFAVFRFPIIDRAFDAATLAIPSALVTSNAEAPLIVVLLLQLHDILNHSNLGWTYGWFGHIVNGPAFHEVHYSAAPEHVDHNYSNLFSIWDHIFGTYAPRGDGELTYGLIHEQIPESFLGQFFVPVIGLWRLFTKRSPASQADVVI